MILLSRPQPTPAAQSKAQPDTVHTMAAMIGRLGLTTVPAAWPTGVSQLAIAFDACQRCDVGELCNDWLARAPNPVVLPPTFCPNAPAPAVARAQQAKRRG
ncbi:MAG TPA: DUF6455 family protein [Pseudolabrys sp.]